MKNRLLIAVLLIGCGPGSEMPDAGGGADLDCLGLFDCLSECPAEASPCDDECLARATPDAVAQATALAVCADAAGCGADSACLEANCTPELLACSGSPPIDAGVISVPDAPGLDAPSGEFPARITGTTRDRMDSGGMITESVGSAVFVLDEITGDLLGLPADTYAFYQLQSLSYTVTVSGSAGGCSFSASETVTPSSLNPSENQLVIERASGADGLHDYALSTAYTEPHPGALTAVCSPGGTSRNDLNVEHYVSSGPTPGPRTDVATFVGEYARGPRVSSWDLRAE